jgi:hypothetical protein
VVDSSWGNGMTPGVTVGWTGGYKGPGSKDDHIHIPATLDSQADRCHRLAEYASIVASNRLIHVAGPDLRNTGKGGTTFGGAEFATPAAEVAAGFERVLASRWPPVAVLPTLPDAATLSALLGTPGDLDGVVVYSDPDYRDTTGYADTCREAIPDLARGWDAAGAVVCVSEAVPVPELTAQGWHSVDITGGRKGQRRTFARVATEALTLNREPQHRVATQIAMFGGAA